MVNNGKHDAIDESSIYEAVSTEYDLHIVQMERIKSVFKLQSNDGETYFFKIVRFGDQYRLADLAGVLSHLNSRGVRAAMPMVTRRGRYHLPLPAHRIGYLQRRVVGDHADYASRQERLTTVAAVSYLHRVGTEVHPERLFNFPGLPLVEKLKMKRRTFFELLPGASERCERMQRLPDFIHRGLWYWSSVSSVAHTAPLTRFCHRDMAPHNVIFSENRHPTFIDFDLAGYDHPFVDLLQIVNHTLALNPGVVDVFTDTVDVYRDLTGDIDEQHLHWLWGMFAYPEILVRAVIEWAKNGFDEPGQQDVLTALDRERWRAYRLAEECPFELYYQRMDCTR